VGKLYFEKVFNIIFSVIGTKIGNIWGAEVGKSNQCVL
jgi:hypothetical protein